MTHISCPVIQFHPGFALQALLAVSVLALGGCAVESPRPAAVRPPPPPDTTVYFYPVQGRSPPTAEQQDRDKYERNSWAVQQTGFDPSLANVPPHERVHLVAAVPPPGSGVAAGPVTEAVLGAALAGPWQEGERCAGWRGRGRCDRWHRRAAEYRISATHGIAGNDRRCARGTRARRANLPSRDVGLLGRLRIPRSVSAYEGAHINGLEINYDDTNNQQQTVLHHTGAIDRLRSVRSG
jgi:hypothetical protein